MNREKALAKNTIILAIGNVLPKAVSFVTLPILTACLTKAEYGTYDLVNTLVSLFLPLVTLQIQSAAFRFLIEKRNDEDEQKIIISNIVIFTSAVSAVALIVLFFCLFKYNVSTRLLICAYFLIDILISTARQIIRGLGKNRIYSTSAVINSVFNFLFIVFFVKLLSGGLDGAIASLALALLISQVFILCKIHLFDYVDFKLFDKKALFSLLKYSWPMVPNSLSVWAMRLSDRLVITGFLGIEANAVYSVANKLPILFSVVQNTFTLAWQENASIASKDDDTEKYYSNMFDIVYSVFFAMMSVLMASSPVLFPLLIKGDYDEAYYQLPILYIAIFFNSLSSYLGGIYVAKMETKKVGITTIIAAFCNLAIDFVLVNLIGIYAGSISTLVSYIILTVYRMIDIQKIQKISFNIPKILCLLMVLITMGVLSYQRVLLCDLINIAIALAASVITNIRLISGIMNTIKRKIRK